MNGASPVSDERVWMPDQVSGPSGSGEWPICIDQVGTSPSTEAEVISEPANSLSMAVEVSMVAALGGPVNVYILLSLAKKPPEATRPPENSGLSTNTVGKLSTKPWMSSIR